MTKVNTTKIGDQFETKSLEIIKKVIEDEQLGHSSNYLKIYSHKEYYSQLRKANIKFDLTIEVWPPGASRYVLIYIIECKDYNQRVPVSKIEDFHSKILQISGVNAKGIFISNSPLQKGGLNIAESVGMMVIQGESRDDYKIVLHRINKDHDLNRMSFINETINLSLIDDNTELIEKQIDSVLLNTFFDNSSESKVSYGIDKLSKDDIEHIAELELNKINPRILKEAYNLNLGLLYDYIISEYDIKISELEEKSQLVGSCDIVNRIIGLNKSIKGTSREFFVLSHEFGHFILHQKLSIGQSLYNAFDDSEFNFRTNKYDLTNPKHWIEWQANYFASSLILPQVPFITKVFLSQISLDIKQGKVFLDDQIVNIRDFNDLVSKLSKTYNVAKTTIIIRLNELKWIVNRSRLKSVGQLLSEYQEELYI